MGKPDVPFSNVECRSVLESIQNEFDQLRKEENSISHQHGDLSELLSQRSVLLKAGPPSHEGGKCCLLCCSPFNLLFKRKLLCQTCGFLVCRSCSTWDHTNGQWVCTLCHKQSLLNVASRQWLWGRIKDHFRNFSAAKALESFCHNRRIDSENDSGYGATGELPLLKIFSSLKMTDDEGEEEQEGEEEEVAEIHYSIETILEGLLGGTLDDASVDLLHPHSSSYVDLFMLYHGKLVEVIGNLSKALQKALHNLPAENGVTPTTAHAALKNVVRNLVGECEDLPPSLQESEENLNVSLDLADIFGSYDSLVAAAIINKVFTESQSKFSLQNDIASTQEPPDEFESENNTDLYDTANSTPFDLPVESVQIEEIEEITREFTEDSDDEQLSSISRWSNRSIDEVVQRGDSGSTTPFPELGDDLDVPSSLMQHTSWEENWLFRKRRRLPLYSNLKFQLLTYCEEPPTMLIPQPLQDITDVDELSSELSETLSAGSLEFSTDTDEEEEDIPSHPPSHVTSQLPLKVMSPTDAKSLETAHGKIVENEKCEEAREMLESQRRENCEENLANAGSVENLQMPPRPGTIAEREHQKWQNAVSLENNPYSAENITKRSDYVKNILKEAVAFEEFERRLSLSDGHSEQHREVNCGPRSIDGALYRRDYYVNHLDDALYPMQKSDTYESDDCFFDPLSEEALNSFEEKTYVRSGKLFTMKNQVRRLEEEVLDGPPHSSNQAALVDKECGVTQEKIKKSKSCRKVHSLTARSLSREFRDLAKQNTPKPMNRTAAPAPRDETTAPVDPHNGGGYTSDESSTSASSVPRGGRRPLARSILERATYWERRAERGLLSDAAVHEEFPGVDI